MAARRQLGILTFHRCINYGSYWQARCLAEGLQARGHKVELLDHHSCEVTWAEWRCAFQPLLPQRVSSADQRLYGLKTRKFLSAFERLPLSPPFSLDDPSALARQDTVVVGSDEVWNLTHPWYGGRGLFYGEGINARKLVSYAASFGNYDAAAGLDPSWAERLNAMKAISVRDENSRALVRDATGRDPAVVLDPVLQFPPPLSSGSGSGSAERPYLAIYGHGMPTWFGERVAAWARSRGLRTISIGYRNDWADEQRLATGPEEFAQAMAGAAAVATNFFHGCVFALLHQRPFVCVASPYRANKLRDLTRSVGAESHLIDDGTPDADVDLLLDSPLDALIAERIAHLRTESDAYLATALA